MRHGGGVGGVFGGGERVGVWGVGGWRGYDKLKSDRITTDKGPQKYQKNRVKKNSYRGDIVTRNTVYVALFPSPYSSHTLFRMNFGQMGRLLHSQFPLYKGLQTSSFLLRLLFLYWRRREGSRGYFSRCTDAIGMVFQDTMSLPYQSFLCGPYSFESFQPPWVYCNSVLAGLPSEEFRVQCCFTSTAETVRSIRDWEPKTATSTFTQLLRSEGN